MASKVKSTISIDEAFVRELEGASRRGQKSRSRLDDKEFKKGHRAMAREDHRPARGLRKDLLGVDELTLPSCQMVSGTFSCAGPAVEANTQPTSPDRAVVLSELTKPTAYATL